MRRAAAASAVLILLISLFSGCARPDFIEVVTLEPRPAPVATPSPTPYMDALTEVSRLVDLFDPYEGDLHDVPAPGQVHHAWQYVEMLLEELPEMGYKHGPGVLLTYEETDFLWADRRLKPYLVIQMDNGDLVCYVRYLEESEYMIESLENKAEELKKKIEYVRSPYNDVLHYVIIADNTKIFADFLNGRIFYTPGPAQDMPAVVP